MQSQVALRTSLFVIALVLGLSTLSGTILALKVRDELEGQTAARRSDIARLDAAIDATNRRNTYKEVDAKAKKLEASIEKKQIEEKAVKAADRSAAAPTANSKKNCSKPNSYSNPSQLDVVVNKKHCIQPLTYTPNTSSVSCAGGGTATIATSASSGFKALCKAARAAGAPLGITSSYRSYDTQVSTYNYWVSQGGQPAADRYSARPGYSEHQTGLSVDFSAGKSNLDSFTGTKQQKWMLSNAYKYGWIQRYTSANSAETGYNAESWHYRYIGRDAAARYASSGSNSLESFWNISGGNY